jgi:WD40 repeat protein
MSRGRLIVLVLVVFAVGGGEAWCGEQPRLDVYGDPLPDGALARLGTARLRHADGFLLHFTADGKTLISAGQDQTVRFWDLESGKLQRLQRLPQSLLLMALSADGKTAVLRGEENLHLWNIAAAKETSRIATGKLNGVKQFNDVVLSPDGKIVAAGNRAGGVRLWDVVSGKERTRYATKDKWIKKLAFASDGKTLAAVGNAHLFVWNVADGKELYVKPVQSTRFFTLPFSADGKLLALPSQYALGLYDAATGKDEPPLPFDVDKNQFRNFEVAFAPDKRTLAIGFEDQLILWDHQRRAEVKRLPGYHAYGGTLHWLGFSPDGKRLASLRRGKIALWDVASGKQLLERPSHSAEINGVTASPDGKFVASAAGGDRAVRLWDAHTGKPLHVWPMPHRRIAPLFFTSDSGSLIAGGLGGDCRMWDTRGGKERRVFALPKDNKDDIEQISALTLSADGKRLTAISLRRTNDKGIFKGQRFRTSWNVADGKVVQRGSLVCDSRPFTFFEELSRDGRFLTTCGQGSFSLYDVAADRPVPTPRSFTFSPAAFSADSKLLAVGGHQGMTAEAARVLLRDLESNTQVLSLAAGRVWHRVFSPDGRYLLTVGESELRLWELASGKEALRQRVSEHPTAPGTSSFATCLAFSADGRSAVMGMHDSNVLIWDLAPATRRKRRLNAEDLTHLWSDLASADAARAYQAAAMLIADPEHAVPFLREHQPPVKEDAPRIRRLIADLDSDQFPVRNAAVKELEKMDDAAHAVLRQALKGAPTLELRRRIETLLSVSWLVQAPQKLRQIRAVMVLEQIGDAEARRVLQRLAEGATEARQTREAKAALQRLGKRSGR